MCVLICLLRSEGRSNFFPHISQGSHVLSLFLLIGLSLGTICSGLLFVISDSEHSNFIYQFKKNSKSETCALLTGHFFNLKMHPFSVQFICITYIYLVVTSADVWRTVVCSGNRWRQEWRGYCRRREEQFFASCCKQTKNILESRLSNKSTFWNSGSMYLQLWRKSTWFWRTVELWFGLV